MRRWPSGRCHALHAAAHMLHDLPTEGQDPDDPIAFINTDIAAAFKEMCRQTTFDTLSGRATKYSDGGRVQPGDAIPTIAALGPFHGYFRAMRSTASDNRYVDHRGHTHLVEGTTGGQQGEGMEMCVCVRARDVDMCS